MTTISLPPMTLIREGASDKINAPISQNIATITPARHSRASAHRSVMRSREERRGLGFILRAGAASTVAGMALLTSQQATASTIIKALNRAAWPY